MEYVTREKSVLQMLSSCASYFVKLYCTFQDTERLYFVLAYAKNGELLSYINKNKAFSLNCTQYYTAELVLALEALHSKGIIHRDLKPENVLFDENWHILITDFGSAKIVPANNSKHDEDEVKRRNSFVGTAQYVSPELLTGNAVSYASDLWALGCIVFQMVSGLTPFRDGSEYMIFQKIMKLEYEFPEGFDKAAKDFVEQLLVLEPQGRLGAEDARPYQSLREHRFLAGLDFEDLGPPPELTSASDVTDAKIPDNLEPGLDGQKVSRLHLDMICPSPNAQTSTRTRKKSEANRNIVQLDNAEVLRRLEAQKLEEWHELVEGNLILKKGLIDKKKGLFPRRRMFLLTMGPHLYYVDPSTMALKGEIPWSADLKTEAKNFKTFMVHTVRINGVFMLLMAHLCLFVAQQDVLPGGTGRLRAGLVQSHRRSESALFPADFVAILPELIYYFLSFPFFLIILNYLVVS